MIDSMIRENLLFSPDYASMKSQDAVEDIKKRIANHEKIYSPLSDEMQTYIRILNGGRQLIVNKVNGYVLGKIVFFLMNLRANHAPIYITRHGESEFNVEGKIGGDTNLSTRGREYAKMLGEFIKAQQEEFNGNDVKVWCSTLKRTIETASFISGTSPMQWRALSEIEVGTCDGMTYKEIESFHPEEFKARKADKLRYRYPRGESYLDVIQRLEPVIFELERATTPVLVIGHRAVLRCLYAYFVELPAEDVPHIKIPLHTVIKMIPKSYGTEVKTLAFDIASVDQETDQLLT